MLIVVDGLNHRCQCIIIITGAASQGAKNREAEDIRGVRMGRLCAPLLSHIGGSMEAS